MSAWLSQPLQDYLVLWNAPNTIRPTTKQQPRASLSAIERNAYTSAKLALKKRHVFIDEEKGTLDTFDRRLDRSTLSTKILDPRTDIQ